MPRNIKGVKKTCVGLRHGQNSFPCVAPFVDAGQTRTGEFWFRSESRQEASWTRIALQRQECQKISFRLLNGKIGIPSSATDRKSPSMNSSHQCASSMSSTD